MGSPGAACVAVGVLSRFERASKVSLSTLCSDLVSTSCCNCRISEDLVSSVLGKS